jgi:hypothetical protein
LLDYTSSQPTVYPFAHPGGRQRKLPETDRDQLAVSLEPAFLQWWRRKDYREALQLKDWKAPEAAFRFVERERRKE